MKIMNQFIGVTLGLLPLAMASSVQAQIIYSNFSSSPLEYIIGTTNVSNGNSANGQWLTTLPLAGTYGVGVYAPATHGGANQFGLAAANSTGALENGKVEFSAAVNSSGLYVLDSQTPGQTWADVSSSQWYGNISFLNQSTGTTTDLRSDPTYIPFEFEDSADNNDLDYGYVTVETFATGSGTNAKLNLDILGYAYETSGSPIETGSAVPEPSSCALLGLGALAIAVRRRVFQGRSAAA